MADIYLCGNAPHDPADIVLRTVAPCVAAPTQDADEGGAPGAGILGRAVPRRHRKKRHTPEPLFAVEIVDVPDMQTIVDTPLIKIQAARRARHRAEDELLLVGLL